ncbi:hypothetical protein P3T73_06270 [Kiritimatiellota bacterium B12222]|nr:hypothetical protein P3T73_06270 [Kiritimatiellota bacterium B12222]
MPLVNDDWRDPVTWLRTKIVYAVLKDGPQLRFCRATRSGQLDFFLCREDRWAEDSEFKKRLLKERKAGALLVTGLAPHQVMIRPLTSPLKDKAKSAEIWGTLLDAAIPFSLEKCHYAFLPQQKSTQEGLSCLAVAARVEDLESHVADWAALDLEPDLAFAEELVLPRAQGNPLWKGGTRTVFSAWDEDRFIGGGGALKPELREKVLARFTHAQTEELHWHELGPASGNEENILEQALCMAVLRSGSGHANLLAQELASKKLHTKFTGKSKTLKVGVLLALLLLFLVPLTLRHQLRAYQRFLTSEIAETYTQITGGRSNAPGQEVRLAERYLDAEWSELWTPVERLTQASTSLLFIELAFAAEENGVVFSSIDLQKGLMTLTLLGTEEQVNAFAIHLQISGWEVELGVLNNGTWKLKGVRI